MRWLASYRADPYGRVIADHHYNRQRIGAKQFVPPGACIVLVIPDVALWITSWPMPAYVKHAWPGAWICSAFRNERGDDPRYRSSDLIREAVAATRAEWPDVPAHGMITFVDERKVRRKRDPGRCFARAGFDQLREYDVDAMSFGPLRTREEGLLVFGMLGDAMPAAEPALTPQLDLFTGAAS